VSLAVDEVAVVVISVGPEVVSLSVGEVLLEKTSKGLSVFESHCSIAPFHEIFELSFIP
jgi:hypothetical protein